MSRGKPIILLLLWVICGAFAQVSWTSPFAVLTGVSFSWSPTSFSSMSFLINPDLAAESATRGTYAAFGLARDGGMSGNAVICTIPVSGSSVCGSYTMVNWNIAASPVSFANLTATAQLGGISSSLTIVNFTVDLGLMMSVGVATGVDVTQGQRAVFASGNLDGTSFPVQHKQTSDFMMCATCGTLSSVPSLTLVPWIVAIVIIAVPFIVALFWNRFYPLLYLRKIWQKRISLLSPIVVIAVCSIIFLALFSASYASRSATAPVARAFGQLACFYFALIIIPAVRVTQLGRLIGVPFDRIVWLHPLLAMALISATTIHLILIYQTKGSASLAVMGPIRVNFAGFVAWILMLVMLVFATVRHASWFPGGYDIFRYTHVIFIAVVIFAVVHNVILIAMMIPGLLLWIGDRYLRYRYDNSSNAQVELLHYDSSSKVITATIRVSWETPPGPCQYAFISCEELGYISHPFTIAQYSSLTPEEMMATAAAVVQQQQPPNATGIGGLVTLYIKSSPNAKSTWTGRLRALIENKETHNITKLSVSAPVGELSVSVDDVEFALLIAGGIGITPMLSLLQHIVKSGRPRSKTQRVHVIWVVKEASLLQQLSPVIDKLVREAARRIGTSNHDQRNRSSLLRVSVEYYLTGNLSPIAAQRIPVAAATDGPQIEAVEMIVVRRGDMTDFSPRSSSSPLVAAAVAPPSVIPGRPDIGAIFAKMFAFTNSSFGVLPVSTLDAQRSEISQQGEAVVWSADRSGCFTCGPTPLMDQVERACSIHNVPLHRESFQL